MSMFGADVGALEAAAFQLTAAADELDSSAKQLSMALGSLSWLGQVAIRFSDAWSTRHSAEMRLTSSYLRENATRLHEQAGQQRQASMAGSSWSISPTGTNGSAFGQGGKPDLGQMSATQRDTFNRAMLANDLARLLALKENGRLTDSDKQHLVNAEAIQRELDEFDRVLDPITGVPVGGQLYIYEPLAYGGDGRAAVALGNLETADHVAFMVSGMGSQVSGMSGGRSTNVYNESRWASDGGDSVAIVDWVGYDAPSGDVANQVLDVKDRDMAEAGAAVLAEDVARFNRVRACDAHVTVIGNSYGSTTAAIAADVRGLAADDLILTGSPGAGGSADADELSTGRDHTWVGAASRDVVSHLGVTGWTDPTSVLTRSREGMSR